MPTRPSRTASGAGILSAHRHNHHIGITLVVVRHGAGPARHHRQARLGPVQCLALGLLIEAEHHRPFRGIHGQPDDVDELGLEVRIVGALKVSVLHGLRLWSAQTLAMVSLPTLNRFASDRVVQCVPLSSGFS